MISGKTKNKRRWVMRKAFTLVELIVVIAIIAVLAAVVAPNAFKAIEKGKVSAFIGDYKAMKTSAMAFYSDIGYWPDNTSNGSGFINNSTGSVSNLSWDGPYLEKWPMRNPWSGNYSFNSSSIYDWSGDGTPEQARYITATNIPATTNTSAAGRVDLQLDGVLGNGTGTIRYTYPAANTTLLMADSYD